MKLFAMKSEHIALYYLVHCMYFIEIFAYNSTIHSAIERLNFIAETAMLTRKMMQKALFFLSGVPMTCSS